MRATTLVFSLAVMLLSLSSCAPVPIKYDGGPDFMIAAPISFDDLEVAEIFGDFGLFDIVEYEEDELGVQLRYLSKASIEHYVDVYIYPLYQSKMVSLADSLEFEQYQLNAEIDQSWDEPQGQSSSLIQTYRPRD